MDASSKREALKDIKQKIGAGKWRESFDSLIGLSSPDDDFVLQTKYASLFKAMADHLPELKTMRVAVLASSTVTHFNDVLKVLACAGKGLRLQIYEAEYSTIHQTIIDPQSQLYEFKPDVVFVFTNYRDIKCDLPAGSGPTVVDQTISAAVNECVSLWKALRQKSNCHIIQSNAALPYHRVFGNYETTPGVGANTCLAAI